ncbi:MAG: aminoglycoside phosphotransferase family protein [Tannerellaceae bacterium]|nr:aminoglycoside phosphotransferase family protein [Tannerellaceae bacterium]
MAKRDNIYYWKCDRPLAFYGLDRGRRTEEITEEELGKILDRFFRGEPYQLHPGKGQGNHLTYVVETPGKNYFIRLETGNEADEYMEVETHLLNYLSQHSIPVVNVYKGESKGKDTPCSYQIMDLVPFSDLNELYKARVLQEEMIMKEIGRHLARWQSLTFEGFGSFDSEQLKSSGQLKGLHTCYRDYFFLNWERHLRFLNDRGFLSSTQTDEMDRLVHAHAGLLNIQSGCLVHKDLALWNILGEPDRIHAFIDWDDAISGDVSDDLSLIGCFHSGKHVQYVIEGYKEIRKLPEDMEERFWLHLLRNMIVKSVLRVGGGYFERNSDFFLIDTGSNGESLREFTLNRIRMACAGLKGKIKIEDL